MLMDVSTIADAFDARISHRKFATTGVEEVITYNEGACIAGFFKKVFDIYLKIKICYNCS